MATITLTGNQLQYSPLVWPTSTELPDDLEAITVVPSGGAPSYIVSSSSGKVYHLKLDASTKEISILKVFDFPGVPKGSNFEGFALQEINGSLLAVWAHRGADAEAAVIYWGKLNLTTYQISQIGSARFKVPWPEANVRHISDLKVDPSGVLFISAATDTGDDGPFSSAVYAVGAFNSSGSRVTMQQNPQLVPLYRLPITKSKGLNSSPVQQVGWCLVQMMKIWGHLSTLVGSDLEVLRQYLQAETLLHVARITPHSQLRHLLASERQNLVSCLHSM